MKAKEHRFFLLLLLQSHQIDCNVQFNDIKHRVNKNGVP